jgi:Amt family ammonium transporter
VPFFFRHTSSRLQDVLFMLFGATLVFFMQVGFALLEVGSVSIRNTKNTLFKNLLDVCCGALTFYLVGYGLLYGEGNGFAGGTKFAMSSGDFDVSFDNSVSKNGVAAKSHARFVFAFAFAATSSTIVSGALAERFMFKAYALYSATITGLLYPIVAHWTWSEDGWASPLKAQGTRLFGSGAVDYGGACVVHVTGGLAAFIACIVVGPRVGRFNAGIPMPMPMQSPVFQTAGTMFLWFGWYGFNCVAVGSLEGGNAAIAAKAAVATTLAAAAGGGATMLTDAYMWPKKLEPRRMNNGILCGLVAVSGCAGLVEPWAAVLIGAIAGLIYVISSYFLLVWHVDDVVDAVPVHFFGGIWGIIAPALFTNETDYVLRYGHPTDSQEGGICGLFMGCASGGAILGANVVLLISSVAWIGVTSWVSLLLIKRGLGSLRVRVQDEMKGMDASQHGGRSYTEFQTTVFTFKTPGGGRALHGDARARGGRRQVRDGALGGDGELQQRERPRRLSRRVDAERSVGRGDGCAHGVQDGGRRGSHAVRRRAEQRSRFARSRGGERRERRLRQPLRRGAESNARRQPPPRRVGRLDAR